MSICAYCKLERPSTKEHIIPAFLYRFQKEAGEGVLGWNDVAEKMLNYEAVIGDVCGTCNGGVLSMLDSAGKCLLERSRVLVHNYTRSNIEIRYNYDILTRWLIKLSFNSARIKGELDYLFENYIEYILKGEPRPKVHRLSIIAYMAKAELVSEHRAALAPYLHLAEGSNLLNPFLVRITNAKTPSQMPYNIRGVFLGPLMFFLVFYNDGISPGFAASLTRRISKEFQGSVLLSPKRGYINLFAGTKSWIDMYEDQVLRTKALGYDG